MHRIAVSLFALFFLFVANVEAGNGLVNVRSQFGVQKTMDRLEKTVKTAGMHIFARIDHAKGAAKIGKTLRPTQLLIFGSPKAGTPLMKSDQRVGLDLPLKVLVWKDAEGHVWFSYTRPGYMLNRFGISNRPKVKEKMAGILAKFARVATRP
ncbi:MAG: DUF302 domain-containing protein [gamma proteobacterium endosymbiont of Lamellibrachia anaximandri]|nr:DUF302 domain-containing protein [gamma proteobacterium endosymbiont of Lamellibrachia anaximandri]MBL3619140.1 DUF302 domain-containing protein [gamma proteobacterium endosymbiont of Lamellibrachia anaximandri]